MRLKLSVIFIALVFVAAGCTVKTQIIEPDGSTYTIKSDTDALVVMKGRDWEATIDNRGKPNIFESLLGWMLLKAPETVQAK